MAQAKREKRYGREPPRADVLHESIMISPQATSLEFGREEIPSLGNSSTGIRDHKVIFIFRQHLIQRIPDQLSTRLVVRQISGIERDAGDGLARDERDAVGDAEAPGISRDIHSR
ncbi:uncharacterized protein DNG_06234 [Cephalotrichum gorgonifer]|uniref:Uncharacterized protein n=1 Tax=Cephalotrichum gorgonifer TaxID=2041049 RepID=A0AAE8MZE4_9PEZI|nr:uncharacterized protein DNG_06234 [Cephalotrichum gorgonifer]